MSTGERYTTKDKIRDMEGGCIFHAVDSEVKDKVLLIRLKKPEGESAFISAKKLIDTHTDGFLDVYDAYEDDTDYVIVTENRSNTTLSEAVNSGAFTQKLSYVTLVKKLTELVKSAHDQGFAWNHFSLDDIETAGKELYFLPPCISKENPDFQNAVSADTNTIGSVLYVLADGEKLLGTPEGELETDDREIAHTIKHSLAGATDDEILSDLDRIPLDRVSHESGRTVGSGKLLWILSAVLGAAIIVIAVSFFINPLKGMRTSGTESAADVEAVVPNLVGMTEEDARKSVTDIGVGIKVLGESASNETAGTVVEQDTPAGTQVDRHTTIGVYISAGPQEIMVPNVVGMLYPAALTKMENAGFSNVTLEKGTSPYVDKGHVLSISSGNTKKMLATSRITLTVCTGTSENATTTVDTYRGLTQEDAVNLLAKSGLFVTYADGRSDRYDTGDVMSQNIYPSMEVPAGTSIVLTICRGTPDNDAKMTAKAKLSAPTSYLGGSYLLTLEQTVDGVFTETTVRTGNKMEFPFELTVMGRAADGVLHLYEADGSGSYVSRAMWDISFK